jgi:pimeloyl-ACP methyl ester carboxylesterase
MLVMASLRNEPQTIIAHSLGSVVAYRLLRDQRLPCRRLITIGSPLGFRAVRELLDGKFTWPVGLTDWRNFYDKHDLVALGKPFAHSAEWRPRIIHTEVDNRDFNSHGAMGYLKLPLVAAALSEVLP